MTNLVKGKTGDWEVVIGLETHAQIISNSKMFSGSKVNFGDEPNNNVSFIDAGYPGVLPSPNEFCVKQAIIAGLALNGNINLTSYFDRKHYFYPDSPLGYQITQFYVPIMEHGFFNIDTKDGVKKIGINRLHIENDAGKLMHEHHKTKSFVDLNRAGTGLMEIVSEPDFRSKEEVADYVNKLRTLLKTLGVCDGNMEEGSLRCDVNISVRKPGEKFRNRVEIKNMNSIKFIMQAIDYEVAEHIKTWESGGEIVQQTKLFNPSEGRTYTLRTKEDAGDYRYVREPDILPLVLEQSYVDGIKASLPEFPDDKKNRYITQFGLHKDDALLLTNERENADFFEESLKYNISKNPKSVASFIITNLFAFLNSNSVELKNSPITPKMIGELVDLIDNKTISSKIAKEVFEIMWNNKTPQSPADIVKERGLVQITDTSAIEAIVKKVADANPDKIAEIKAGKDKLIGWFVGQVMKESQGKANPDLVNELLKKYIG